MAEKNIRVSIKTKNPRKKDKRERVKRELYREIMNFRLPNEMADALRLYAFSHGMTMTAVAELAIGDYLDRMNLAGDTSPEAGEEDAGE